MGNYYELLGIDVNSTESEISEAIKKFKLKWQPRVSAHDINVRQEAEQMMRESIKMQETLLDPAARAKYDESMTDEKSKGIGVVDEDGTEDETKGGKPEIIKPKDNKPINPSNTSKVPIEVMNKLKFFYETQEYEQLKVVVRDVIANDPNNIELLTYYGYAFSQTGDNRTAEKSCIKAVEIDPSKTGWAMAILTWIYHNENNTAGYRKYMELMKQYHHDFFYYRARFSVEQGRQYLSTNEFLEMFTECPDNLISEFNGWQSNDANFGLVEKRVKDNLTNKLSEILNTQKNQLDLKKEIKLIGEVEKKLLQMNMNPARYFHKFTGQTLVGHFAEEILNSYNNSEELIQLKGLEIKELSEGVDKRLAILESEKIVEKSNQSFNTKMQIMSFAAAAIALVFFIKYNKYVAVSTVGTDNGLGILFSGSLRMIFESPYNYIIALVALSISAAFMSFVDSKNKKAGSNNSMIIFIGIFVSQFLNGANIVKNYHNGVNGVGDMLDTLIMPALSGAFIALAVGIPVLVIYGFIIRPLISRIVRSFR